MRQTVRSFPWRPPGLAAICISLVLLAGGVCARAQVARGGRIRTDVNLVSLTVSVQDAEGRPVAGLSREAFSVFDEGTKQQVAVFEAETQQPLDLALMIDTSLSAASELEFESAAALRFIRKVVRPQDALAVYTFAERVDRLTPYTPDVATLEAGLKRMRAGAGTSLYDAIYLASGELAQRPAPRRRVIVLVTDAGETTSRAAFEDARHSALAAEALLYTIVIRAFKSDALRDLAGEHALTTITDSTGGAMFLADDLKQLDALYAEIDYELRTQYLLAFYPQPPPPKKSIRHLEVQVHVAAGTVDKIPLRIRHRRFYLMEGATE
jgi:Ca-activated chloride channel family protein